jgi:hypothetical protein
MPRTAGNKLPGGRCPGLQGTKYLEEDAQDCQVISYLEEDAQDCQVISYLEEDAQDCQPIWFVHSLTKAPVGRVVVHQVKLAIEHSKI